MSINIGTKKIKIYIGDTKVSKVYLGNTKIYSSGSNCTYICDDNTYQEEVDEGASCLSPKTFTPEKSGWQFAGWRQDAAASGSVLSSLVMGDAPITLYAVFRQTITLSYNGNSATGGSTPSQTGTRYYNNGNVTNPVFTLSTSGFTRTGYTFSKWALGSTGGTQYTAGASVTLAASATAYAVWTATNLTVTGNTKYISTSGEMGAGRWYSTGDANDTSYINVNYAGYPKIKIAFNITARNIGSDKPSTMYINGAKIYDSRVGLAPSTVISSGVDMVYRYTATYTGITKIPVETHVENYVDAGSWADLKASIVSAELSM